jgi:hypothetical protein
MALAERDLDEPLDGAFRLADIPIKAVGSLGFRDSVRIALRVDEAVPVADGWVTG